MKLLLPKSDFCLKELFENEIVRTHFISDVLGIPLKDIRSVRLRNTFLRRSHRRQKLGILDVLIELNNSIKINIEIQLLQYKYWTRRQLFYLARMFTEDLTSGEDYEKLNKCISISILDFNLNDRPDYHSVYRFRDSKGNEFSDILELHTIELRKKLAGNGDIDNWIRFFNAESEADLNMIQTNNTGILEAIRELKKMSLGDRIRARYEAHQKAVRDHKAMMNYARDTGLEEGRKKGLEEGRQKGLKEGMKEGLKTGRLEGESIGIRVAVLHGIEDGLPKELIISRLMQDFNLDEVAATEKYQQYSK